MTSHSNQVLWIDSHYHEDHMRPLTFESLKMSVKDYPEIDLTEIKRWLKRGDITQLAKKRGITAKYASSLLSEDCLKRNMDFIQAAADLSAQRKAQVVGSMDRLKQITNP